jgi:thiol:disulfide interchange protein
MKIKSNSIFIWVLTALTLLIISSCSPKTHTQIKKNNSLHFKKNTTKSLSDVLDLAEKENKLVFIEFYADWCLPCQLLDEEVFNKKEVIRYFEKKFINYKVNIEKSNGPNIKLLFNTSKLPTLLFLNTEGRELKRVEKTIFQEELLNVAKSVISIHG